MTNSLKVISTFCFLVSCAFLILCFFNFEFFIKTLLYVGLGPENRPFAIFGAIVVMFFGLFGLVGLLSSPFRKKLNDQN